MVFSGKPGAGGWRRLPSNGRVSVSVPPYGMVAVYCTWPSYWPAPTIASFS
jgi:hypothetical protein